MENILPYEVKYSTLKKIKSYDLHREVMEELLYDFEEDMDDEGFESILNRLEEIALKVQTNYFDKLLQFFKEKIRTESLKQSLDKINCPEPNYIEAINIIEEDLKIAKNSQSIGIQNIGLHISDSIYEIEYRKLKTALEDFREAFYYLNSDVEIVKVDSHVQCQNSNEVFPDVVTRGEYLQYVVYNEAWNFLSHMAYAIASFGTPGVYISNIDKGTSHLRRAILDIYDGLILETQEIDEEYLSIRALKLNSLGNNEKIISLSSSLKEYYLKKRNI